MELSREFVSLQLEDVAPKSSLELMVEAKLFSLLCRSAIVGRKLSSREPLRRFCLVEKLGFRCE